MDQGKGKKSEKDQDRPDSATPGEENQPQVSSSPMKTSTSESSGSDEKSDDDSREVSVGEVSTTNEENPRRNKRKSEPCSTSPKLYNRLVQGKESSKESRKSGSVPDVASVSAPVEASGSGSCSSSSATGSSDRRQSWHESRNIAQELMKPAENPDAQIVALPPSRPSCETCGKFKIVVLCVDPDPYKPFRAVVCPNCGHLKPTTL